MNILLWVLQILFAVHTAMGGIWKFANTTQAIPSLNAIPQGVWVAIAVVELLAALALILPLFNRARMNLAVLAALFEVALMFVYTGLHLASGEPDKSPIVYWLIVAAIGAFIAWGRRKQA